MSDKPRFGHTKDGLPVHARVTDHLAPTGASTYARFNAWLAVKITAGVGSMTCAYLFAVIALISLPAALASGSVIIIVSWVAQTLLQLVLLSIILVGQSVQSVASDARAAKTFEDVETVLDRLDARTEGGLRVILDAVNSLRTDPLARHQARGGDPPSG